MFIIFRMRQGLCKLRKIIKSKIIFLFSLFILLSAVSFFSIPRSCCLPLFFIFFEEKKRKKSGRQRGGGVAARLDTFVMRFRIFPLYHFIQIQRNLTPNVSSLAVTTPTSFSSVFFLFCSRNKKSRRKKNRIVGV